MKKGIEIFSLSGKTALITGATGYLGSAMALILAEAGANVLVNSRSEQRSNSLVKKIVDLGYKAESAVFDVTDQKAVDKFFLTRQELPLHILINNAYVGNAGNMETSKSNSYINSYHVTVVAAHNLLNSALISLRKAVQQSGDASVINMTSMYAMVSPDKRIYESVNETNPPFYGAAKAALLQWTRYGACEFGAENIRFNSISPGPFPSVIIQRDNPEFIKKLAYKVPMSRIGLLEEIKGPVLFLASPAASFVNGSNLVVDGGWTCW